MRIKKNKILWASVILFLFGFAGLLFVYGPQQNLAPDSATQTTEIIRGQIVKTLGAYFEHNCLPTQTQLLLDGKVQDVKVKYTIDPVLQAEAEDLLAAYKPDYGAVVIMDALTGAVKAMVSTERGKLSTENLALRATYPAASVFKIVTATAALDRYGLSPDTLVSFNGANHTLYKKNIMNMVTNRWTRSVSLRDAFAHSINAVFGRLTFEHMQPKDIEDYALRFGFNTKSTSDLPFNPGVTQVPLEKNFALAEIASGYNRITRMSPVQGAMIASSVANEGTMRVPYIVESLQSPIGKVLWKPEPLTAAITMSKAGNERLKELMEETINSGTSHKSFRNLLRDRKFAELELGGKTGSLQGDNPKGKVDWFVGYAIGSSKDRLAIGAITVNRTYWTVKSAFLAQSLFKKHFKAQFSPQNQKFFNAGLNQQ